MVEPPEDEMPGLPVLFFTEVPEDKAGKNRLHIDVVAQESVDEDVIRLKPWAPPSATGQRKKAPSGP